MPVIAARELDDLSRPVAARATRIALIAASVPELTKRTRSIDGISIATRCAELGLESVGAPKLVPRRPRQLSAFNSPLRRVAVDERSPRHHVVDVGVAVDVLEMGAARRAP